MEPKPLLLGKLAVFGAVNMTATIAKRRKGIIALDAEVSEPILIFATSVEVADYVLQNSLIYFDEPPYMMAISHYLYENEVSETCRPLIRLVNNDKDFPSYLYN